ncbi:hypothetical protein FRC09_010857 [Ceratobasidium sp. 395]|nr:hypothetical protein FRC09_010857 [Ceratobasidium sp. 395]
MRKNLVPNPAPDYITGCIFRNNPLAILPYIAPFLYETALFLMTVYKTWKISHGQPLETPLVTRLMRDGSQYYFVVIGTLIFIGLGSLVPAIRPAVNGSGRLILSTRSFYVDVTATDNWLEMSASSRHRSGETSGTE